jgi:pimeloyl-ACP methyl ester carboxylesterase
VATFVLIPGAGIDPRVYRATIEALSDLGQRALAPPIPLEDDDAQPSDHADAIAQALPDEAEPIIVAHSLGAFTGPLLAARVPVAQLILLAPMIPKPRETAGEWWENTRHDKAIAAIIERHGAMTTWGRDAIAEVFLHDVEPAVVRANERFQGAPGRGMFTEPWPLEAWPQVPTRVLVPNSDRLFPLDFQRRVARERLALNIDEMAGGHLPTLSRPRELAQRLVELSRRP